MSTDYLEDLVSPSAFLWLFFAVEPSLNPLRSTTSTILALAGPSMINFVSYVRVVFSSDNVQIVLRGSTNKSASVLGQKAIGQPRICVYLTKLEGNAASDAMATISVGMSKLYRSQAAFLASHLPKCDVEFTMQLTYRTPMPDFKFFEAKAEPILNYDGNIFEELAWDEDCAWAEWHSVEDPIKGYELVCTWNRRTLKNALEAAEYGKCTPTEADKWPLTIIKVKDQAGSSKTEPAGFAGRLRALVEAFQASSLKAHFIEHFAAGAKYYPLTFPASLVDTPSAKQVTHHHMVPPPTGLERVIKDLFEEESVEEQGAHVNYRGAKAAPPDSLISRFCLHALRFGTCNIRVDFGVTQCSQMAMGKLNTSAPVLEVLGALFTGTGTELRAYVVSRR